ncbi:hypothetical protein MXB_2497 [Myxobolus squamalis]|nr:hypothetical protein MXB_2497 [Myxobolus squamalis]
MPLLSIAGNLFQDKGIQNSGMPKRNCIYYH